MIKLRIRYTDDAITDLDVIFSYIGDDSRETAIKMLDKLEKAIFKIAEMPRIGAVLETTSISIVQSGY